MGAGDEDDFDALYRRSAPRLMAQAFALTGDRAAAEDLVQDAFGRAWVRWSRVQRLENPEAWIRRVMLNQAISDWRRRSKRPPADPRPLRGEPDLEALWLAAALRKLPPNQRRAVVLHDAAGLSVPEIAHELHAPAGTVKSWISRGRANLSALLTDSNKEPRHART